jgi:hypothetical protein
MTPEDSLLNALEAVGLIHEDWQGIDHENLPKDMREAVTEAIRIVQDYPLVSIKTECPIVKRQYGVMEEALTRQERIQD